MGTWHLSSPASFLFVFTHLFTPASFLSSSSSSLLSQHASGAWPFFSSFLSFQHCSKRNQYSHSWTQSSHQRNRERATQSCWRDHFNARAYRGSSHGPRLRAHEAWGGDSQHINSCFTFVWCSVSSEGWVILLKSHCDCECVVYLSLLSSCCSTVTQNVKFRLKPQKSESNYTKSQLLTKFSNSHNSWNL